MIKYLAITAVILCSYKAAGPKPKLKVVEFISVDSYMGDRTSKIYTYGSLVMYNYQYEFSSSEMRPVDSDADKLEFKQTTLFEEVRDVFVVAHKDSSYGYAFDAYDSIKNNKRVLVDSIKPFLKENYTINNLPSIKPDTTTWSADKSQLRNVYNYDNGKELPTTRMVLYYSKKLNHITESYSPVMDSLQKMKLYKIETYVDEYYSEKDKKLWPAFSLVSEMRESRVKDRKEIISYFIKYRNNINRK